ncbi:MAG: TrbG/VirB9 family P-type conjugative transfer protein [Acetobacter malorum]|uniref:TrbG/VirB9 family P-type conjugative transfer protein n=1 Tax=Acetobacter malorum TaxID=178901 RepID=UPI0039EA4C42
MKRCSVFLMMTMSLSGCGSAHDTDPVTVATPGLPSPEKALQESLDRVHAFMASLNDRLDKHVPINIPQVQTKLAVAASSPLPPQPSVQSDPTHRVAVPLPGKGGVTWFGFGDGTPTINCRYPDICILRLDRGETAVKSGLELGDSANWHVDLVRGGKGIHQGWAVAIDPGAQAAQTDMTLKGSLHTYNMILSAQGESMRTIAFTHAPGEPLSQPEIMPQHSMTGTPDFAYHMTGSAPWKPMRVYREAGHTYIQFPPGGINAAPRLVVISPKATNAQDYAVVGDSYVVPRPVDDALLIGNGAQAPEIHITHGGTE